MPCMQFGKSYVTSGLFWFVSSRFLSFWIVFDPVCCAGLFYLIHGVVTLPFVCFRLCQCFHDVLIVLVVLCRSGCFLVVLGCSS